MGVGKVHGEMEGRAIKWALEVSVYSWQPWEWRPPKPDHRIDAWRKKQGPQTVVSKTKHSKRRPKHEAPKSRKRSTQNSKTKHPKLENEAPKSRKRSTLNSKTKHPNLENEAPRTRKRSTQNSKTKHPNLETIVGWRTTTLSLAWHKPNQVEATDA